MSALDDLTEAVAVAYASEVVGITDRQPDAPVDVCRFHRDGADDFIAAIQAALPDGYYLGPDGLVQAFPVAGLLDSYTLLPVDDQ